MKKEKQDKLFSRVNPFNQITAKPKFEVLNRKIKGSKGNPGISKSKSLQARKETLVERLKNRNKQSKFVDKRIGAKDGIEQGEDVMLDRFTAMHQKNVSKYQYDISNQTDSLTHGGKLIDDLESFSDPNLSSDEEFRTSGAIDRDTVHYDHFQGFADNGSFGKPPIEGGKRSKAEVMREVIAKSKAFKYERQRINEENENLRDELNDEFDDLRTILFDNEQEEERISKKNESVLGYDMLLQDLIREKKAKPADRLKTPEEVALEERTKLEELEKARLERMKENGLDESEESDGNELSSNSEDSVEENSEESDGSMSEDSSDAEDDTIISDVPMSDLPYVIPIPFNLKQLSQLCHEKRSFDDIIVILERIIAYNNPLAHPETKPKFAYFYSNMLAFLYHRFSTFSTVENLNKIVKLCLSHHHLFPMETTVFFKSLVFRQYDLLKKQLQSKKRITEIDDSLLFTAKIILSLFSTSDFYNPVVTPLYLLLSFIFEHLKIANSNTFMRVLFLIELYLDSQRDARRIMPELGNCLFASLQCLVQTRSDSFYFTKCYQEFMIDRAENDLSTNVDKICFKTFVYAGQTSFVCSTMHQYAMNCLEKFVSIYKDNIAFVEMIVPFEELLKEKFAFSAELHKALTNKQPLQLFVEKPACIQSLEPDFELGYSLDSHNVTSQKSKRSAEKLEKERAENEMKKLKAQVKAEKKALIKEIRRDNAFITTFKYEKRIKEDVEYKKRINTIMGQIGNESHQLSDGKQQSRKKLLKY